MFLETIERRANGLTRGWVNSTEIVRVLDEGPDGMIARLRDGTNVILKPGALEELLRASSRPPEVNMAAE